MSIKKISVALIGFLLIAVLLLPTALSTQWAKQVILDSFNQDIHGTVQVESVNLSWFGPQKVSGVKLKGPDGSIVASLHSISSDTSLFSFIFGSPTFGDTQLKDLNADLGDPLVKALGANYFPLGVRSSESVTLSDTDLLFRGSSRVLQLVTSGKTIYQGKQGSFSVDCDISPQGSSIKANAQDFPVEVIDVALALNDPYSYGLAKGILGDTLNVKIDQSSKLDTSAFSINLQSPKSRLVLDGVLSSEGFSLSAPVNTEWVFSPSVIGQMMGQDQLSDETRILKPVKVSLRLKNLNIPIDLFKQGLTSESARNISFDLTMDIPSTEWQTGQQTNAVNDLQLHTSALAGHSSFDVSLTGNLRQDGKSFPFKFHSLHRKPLTEDQLIAALVQPQEMSFTLDSLKTKTLDAYFGTGNNWQQTFGKTVSLHIASNNNDLKTLDAKLVSEKIEVPRISLQIDDPIRLGQLQRPISGTVHSDKILFKTQKSTLETFKVAWTYNGSQQTVQADFSGKTVFDGSQVDGLIEGNLFVDLHQEDNPTIRTDVKGKHVPAPLLSLITGRKEWEPVFGSVLDLKVKTHMKDQTGPVQAEIYGSNGKLDFDGQLTKGVLTLNAPLHLSTRATQELGKDVLSDFAPVFGELISAESSISLNIDPEQFSIPLSLNYAEMNFKRAVLDLGKMTFRNGGDVRRLLSVLKADNPKQVEVWATPMYLSMEKGVLRVYRMDMLVLGRYPIATWGQIHFPKDKIDMVLGLSPVALAQSLGVTGLPKGYMLQIPIKGSSSNTKIDSTKVMSRIGALVAQSAGGPEGLVLGTVLDIANGKEPKIPPPTTNPLPWGELTVETPQKNNSSLNPVNDIKNEASKFIKGMFR